MGQETNPRPPSPDELLEGAMPGLGAIEDDSDESIDEVAGQGGCAIVIDDGEYYPPEASDDQPYL